MIHDTQARLFLRAIYDSLDQIRSGNVPSYSLRGGEHFCAFAKDSNDTVSKPKISANAEMLAGAKVQPSTIIFETL